MKEYLFAYGTLQDEEVQAYVFQRTLRGEPDFLEGFQMSVKKMYDRYLVLEPSGRSSDQVRGMVYPVDDLDLLKADIYEGPAYERSCVTLVSGRKAWVYVEKNRKDKVV